ncbi:MAG: thioredoxin-disulfide reductase [Oligoflexales bacterium]
MEKVTIIGTGPAGLTAAIYTARAGLKPLIFGGHEPGGQLTTTTEVENFPGFAEGIMGPQLMLDMTKQAERVGARVRNEYVDRFDLSKKPVQMWIGDEKIETDTLIIATGATAKTLGLPMEKELMGKGISTCATCDGFFFRNKDVMVVGGGDSAMEEATYLARICRKVYLVHRRSEFKASKIMLERAQSTENIEFLVPWTPVTPLADATGLTGVELCNTETQETKSLKVDGLFYGIGHQPNSAMFKPWVETDTHGYIHTTQNVNTNVPGVFAAGDIADPLYKQAITAAGMGCQAALQASRYLEENESLTHK